MEPGLAFGLLLFAAIMLGVLLGTLTGLVPGLHPNNIAIILVSITPVLLQDLYFLDSYASRTIIASGILATAVTHTFLSFIPAAYIGAPEGDTALNLLPAHRLLLEGRAYEATVLSAIGSFGAVVFSMLCLVPFYFIASSHLFVILEHNMVYLLIGISALLVLTESFTERMEPLTAITLSMMVFIISGIFGFVVFELPSSTSMLFPAFSGLFGLSTILYSLFYTPEIPDQAINEPEIAHTGVLKSVISGATFGSVVSALPGITSAHATVMAMLARRNRDPEQVILTLSSVNTANVIFCTGTLYITLHARSGVMMAIEQIMDIQRWIRLAPPVTFILMLITVLSASAFSFFITRYMGRQFSLFFGQIPYRKLLLSIVILLSILVLIFTGCMGLLVLMVATAIGLIPIYCGIRRSNCMGVILLPIIVAELFHGFSI